MTGWEHPFPIGAHRRKNLTASPLKPHENNPLPLSLQKVDLTETCHILSMGAHRRKNLTASPLKRRPLKIAKIRQSFGEEWSSTSLRTGFTPRIHMRVGYDGHHTFCVATAAVLRVDQLRRGSPGPRTTSYYGFGRAPHRVRAHPTRALPHEFMCAWDMMGVARFVWPQPPF